MCALARAVQYSLTSVSASDRSYTEQQRAVVNGCYCVLAALTVTVSNSHEGVQPGTVQESTVMPYLFSTVRGRCASHPPESGTAVHSAVLD
jgi:hypothetical protein